MQQTSLSLSLSLMAADSSLSLVSFTASAAADHDDSDMWMEADELPPPEYSVVRSESRVVRQYSSSSPDNGEATSISRVENFKPEVVISSSSSDPTNPATAEQNFFPSFFHGVPHTLPFKISNTHAASIAGRYNSAGRSHLFDQSILGSGDFAILHGGTFYPDDSRRYQAKSDELFEPVYTNGHGKPIAEPLTQKKELFYPEDPFENFKDFADMNTGSADPAFSHFVVIYANKNATKPHPSHPRPKNIFEQLQLLDAEKALQDNVGEDEGVEREEEVDKKLMKLSKYKTKLAKTKVVKKYKKKVGPKFEQPSPDYTDPLLATS
jgi:hypothetical protein